MYEEYASMLLQITSSTINQFAEQQHERGDDFNVFSILDIERSEVGTHSKFLFELLNPKGCHFQGSVFVDLFLTDVLGLKQCGSVINVKREDPTQENRRIDFTINTDKYLIGIEMKIDAGDQEAQLFDYNKELKSRRSEDEIHLFYLTLFDGTDPSDYSLEGLKKDKVHCISFEKNILPWLESCIELVALKPVIRELINQYQLLIKKLTHQNKELDMKISEEIGKNKETLLAAEQISKSYLKEATKIEANVWFNIISRLRNAGYKCTNKAFYDLKFIEKEIQAIKKGRKDGWLWTNFIIGELKSDEPSFLCVALNTHRSYDYLRIAIFPSSQTGVEKVPLKTFEAGFCNEITNQLVTKFSYLKNGHSWNDFVHGRIDNTFSLSDDAQALARWIETSNDFERNIVNISNKVLDIVEQVENAVSDHLTEKTRLTTSVS